MANLYSPRSKSCLPEYLSEVNPSLFLPGVFCSRLLIKSVYIYPSVPLLSSPFLSDYFFSSRPNIKQIHRPFRYMPFAGGASPAPCIWAMTWEMFIMVQHQQLFPSFCSCAMGLSAQLVLSSGCLLFQVAVTPDQVAKYFSEENGTLFDEGK